MFKAKVKLQRLTCNISILLSFWKSGSCFGLLFHFSISKLQEKLSIEPSFTIEDKIDVKTIENDKTIPTFLFIRPFPRGSQ